MPGFVHLLCCVGRAVLKNGGRALANLVPFGDVAYEIARDAYEEYRRDYSEADLRAELHELASAPATAVRKEAAAVAEREAAAEPIELRLALTSYLSELPAQVRQSLRGGAVSAGGTLQRPQDLLPFLPTALPRFQPGERPLAADWELVELLGKGGFGEVWQARHLTRSTQKPVALKFCLDPVAAESLRNEVAVHDILDRVRQQGGAPGIVLLLETFLRADPPCLMYEYIEGGDLAGLIRTWADAGKLTPARATQTIYRLANIVAAVHRLDPPLVHRDLKPSNILVRSADGDPSFYVADFGIGALAARQALTDAAARHTTHSQALPTAVRGAFTPLYASPEQARGEPPDPRDDVHALGVIWYQLLTGDLGLLAIPPDWRDVVRERGVGAGLIDLLAACLASRADKRPADASALAARLAVRMASAADDQPREAGPNETSATVRGQKRTYTLVRLLAAGEVADVYLAESASSYILKRSRTATGAALLDNERQALTTLLTRAGDASYRKYLPTLAESFPVDDGLRRRVNVFVHEPGFYTLEQVHERHPALDGRHLAWIFKRLLTVLGFAHHGAIVHAAVLPSHVMIHAANHGLCLIGWGQSVAMGRAVTTVSPRYRSWYPAEAAEKRPATAASDLFLAARCMVYLAGGDPVTDQMPEMVPMPMQRFFQSCLLPGVRMRPDDAWALLDDFDELLQQLYGPPKFHELTMP
jgi:hypothetical protein